MVKEIGTEFFVPYQILSGIETGEYEIIQSGIYLLPKAHEKTLFHIFDHILELKFENESVDDKQVNTSIDIIDEKHMIILCKNWDTSESRSLKAPIFIFHIDKDKIFFNFLVENIDSIPRITYTFYRLKEVL